MIGGIVNKLLDDRAKKYAEAIDGWTAEKEITARLRRENSELRQQAADLRQRADEDATDHVRRLSADLVAARRAAAEQSNRYSAEVHRLQAERDAALAAKRVAENALSAFQIPPLPGDAAKREAEQHRTNALALEEQNAAMRQQLEDFETDMAELRARIKELEHRE